MQFLNTLLGLRDEVRRKILLDIFIELRSSLVSEIVQLSLKTVR